MAGSHRELEYRRRRRCFCVRFSPSAHAARSRIARKSRLCGNDGRWVAPGRHNRLSFVRDLACANGDLTPRPDDTHWRGQNDGSIPKAEAISQMLIQYNEERKDHELRQVTLPAAFKSDSMAALYRLLMGLLLSDEASLPVVIIEQTMIFEDAALSKPSFTDGVTTDRDSDGSGGSPSSDLVHAPRLLFEPSVVSNKLVHFNRMPLMDSEPTVPQQLALISSSRIASWHLSPTQLGWLEEDLLGLLYRIINQVLEPESTKAMLALKRYCPEVMKCLSVALGRATRP